MASEPHLLVERSGHIVTLTMNRPSSRNAISAEMVCRLADAWEMINADQEIRCAILCGAGGHFSAGADLKAMAGLAPKDEFSERTARDPSLPYKALLRDYRLTKPLVAAIEGYAVAGGTEILLATDVRVAAETAQFGIAETRRGLFPLGGSTVRLRRQIPFARAMDMLLTADLVDAATAYRVGLVSRIVPDGEALAEATKVAERIAANGPLAVQAVKLSVQETEGVPEADAMRIEFEIGSPIQRTEDAREGATAFAEKRPPRFRRR